MDKAAMDSLDTLYTFNTPYSADSVEWCPHAPFQNTFVCANYQLCEKTSESSQKRLGCILLFSIGGTDGLVLHQTLNTAAVLDQKWCPNQINNFSILGVVNAQSTLEIYKLNPLSYILELITCLEIDTDSENLLLSLDWSTGKDSSQEPHVICSDSKGNCHLFSYSNDKLILLNTFGQHSFEAWIAAYYYWDTNILFTGGDDNLLFKYDIKASTKPVLKNKTHKAGVTSIHSNAEREYMLVTGSYDEILRLWDIRNMKHPSASLKMPGPVWRVKWDPLNHKNILAACMLGGAHIVKLCDSDKLEIIASSNIHKSMTYGADWCYLNEDALKEFECDKIIGTCSFYDNLLCVSKFKS